MDLPQVTALRRFWRVQPPAARLLGLIAARLGAWKPEPIAAVGSDGKRQNRDEDIDALIQLAGGIT